MSLAYLPRAMGWNGGVEVPNVEIFDARAAIEVVGAAVKIVEGSALCEYGG
jgi:hypothetical protein